MTAATLAAIASLVVIAGGVAGVLRSVWRAVSYLERITRKLELHSNILYRHEGRLARLEEAGQQR